MSIKPISADTIRAFAKSFAAQVEESEQRYVEQVFTSIDQVFDFGSADLHYLNSRRAEASNLIARGLLDLPFRHTVFTVAPHSGQVRTYFVVNKSSEGGMYFSTFGTPNGLDYALGSVMYAPDYMATYDNLKVDHPAPLELAMVYAKNKSLEDLGLFAVSISASLSMVLATKGLRTWEQSPTTMERKMARKAGRAMPKSVITKINMNDHRTASRTIVDGDDYTPKRMHLRRGHIRHLPSGDVWVRDSIVNGHMTPVKRERYEVAL